MLQRTIEVHGLPFTQVDIFGCYLPTPTSIESVLDKIHDKRNKPNLCKRSNELVILHSQCYDLPSDFRETDVCNVLFRVEKTSEDSIYNLKKQSAIMTGYQCALAGLEFDSIAQSMFAMNWFEGMIGGFDLDIQKLRKMSGRLLKCVHDRSKSFDKYENEKLEPINQRMNEYSEYVIARTTFELYAARICEIAHYDKMMMLCLYEDYQIMYKIFQLTERIEGKTCITVCNKCRLHFESKKIPGIKICNSCKNKSAEQKKVSRRIDRDGWVSVGTGKCGGGCGSLKIKINTSGSCLKCYRLNL